MDEQDLYKRVEHSDRLERLNAARDPQQRSYNPKHSLFIRRMRLILPILAAIIMAIVLAWSNTNNDTIISAESPEAPKTIGKNELLNAKFDSVDSKAQPYTITADRAVQDTQNEDLVLLEKPLADMLLNSGNWIAIKAQKGNFKQETQKLHLEEDIEIFHDAGYKMETEELYINLQSNTAWSEKDVYGQGPTGTLNATGMKADNEKEKLIFTGPAKLIIYTSQETQTRQPSK